jgi:hypothetical protein
MQQRYPSSAVCSIGHGGISELGGVIAATHLGLPFRNDHITDVVILIVAKDLTPRAAEILRYAQDDG